MGDDEPRWPSASSLSAAPRDRLVVSGISAARRAGVVEGSRVLRRTPGLEVEPRPAPWSPRVPHATSLILGLETCSPGSCGTSELHGVAR